MAEEHLTGVSEQGRRAAAAAGNGHYLHLARAVAAERADRPGDAVAVLAACLDQGAAMRMPARHLLLPALVRLALAIGDTDTAAAATQAAADEAEREPVPVKGAVADHCRGLLTADPAPVLAAAAYHGSAGRPLRRAEALTDAAALLAARGGTAPARDWFDEAVALYREMGARWAVRGASARLREFGIRPGQDGDRTQPAARVGITDPHRGADCHADRRWPVQSADRRRAVPVRRDGAGSRLAHPGEVRRAVANGDRSVRDAPSGSLNAAGQR